MFGNAPRAVWEKWLPPDSQNRITLACRCLLLKIDDTLVLLETGIGAFFEPSMAARYGVENPERHLLIENLEKLGVTPDKIDYVILSHLHFDHAGGLLPAYPHHEKELLFPKATYVVGEEAWNRALAPHSRDRASFIPHLQTLLKASGRLKLIAEPKTEKLLDGRISFFTSSGHTPGHLHSVIHGDHSTLVFAGDLIPGTPWVHLPLTMGYDRNPESLIDEKSELYQEVTKNNWWVFYTHDTEVACSHIGRDEKGRYRAVEVQSELHKFAL